MLSFHARDLRHARGSRIKRLVWVGVVAFAISIATASARADERNQCGCYRSGSGDCYCDKKAKCGCPGECEPKGCEEAREKQMQKEIDAETRKAIEADRKRATLGGDESADKSGKGTGEDETLHIEVPKEPPKTSREAKRTGTATETAPTTARKLTPAQVKQLVKLLEQYLAENPEARSKSFEDLRHELSPVSR